MQKSLRDMNTTKIEPKLLVHCSNGAGRSGVFVLCETLIRLIENNQVCITFPFFFQFKPCFPHYRAIAHKVHLLITWLVRIRLISIRHPSLETSAFYLVSYGNIDSLKHALNFHSKLLNLSNFAYFL